MADDCQGNPPGSTSHQKPSSIMDPGFGTSHFSDASKDAYGAVIYARTPAENKEMYQVHLIASKAKITPKGTPTTKENPNTIPKFELAGVVVAAHQLKYIKEAWGLSHDIKVILWCDARVVLSWLTNTK